MEQEGSAGQQKKALQMFTSRKIVTVKTLVNEQVVLREGYDKKVLRVHANVPQLLCSKIPTEAHCSFPLGLSGICCYVLALLHFLKHYHETG